MALIVVFSIEVRGPGLAAHPRNQGRVLRPDDKGRDIDIARSHKISCTAQVQAVRKRRLPANEFGDAPGWW